MIRFIVQYDPGESFFDGEMMTNATIAKIICKTLHEGKSDIAYPSNFRVAQQLIDGRIVEIFLELEEKGD